MRADGIIKIDVVREAEGDLAERLHAVAVKERPQALLLDRRRERSDVVDGARLIVDVDDGDERGALVDQAEQILRVDAADRSNLAKRASTPRRDSSSAVRCTAACSPCVVTKLPRRAPEKSAWLSDSLPQEVNSSANFAGSAMQDKIARRASSIRLCAAKLARYSADGL